jgi:integrase
MTSFTEKLNQANARLKKGNIRVSIEQHGSKLHLRGTFPPKPNSGKTDFYQQRLSIASANEEGLKLAEAKAKQIAGLLDQGRFDWEVYQPSSINKENYLIKEWLELFKTDYFSVRAETSKTLTTWEIDYFKPLQKIPSDQPLTETLLKKILLETDPDTRTRKRYVLAYAKLADFAGITHNLRRYLGNYSATKANPRDLPDDKLIIEVRESIRNPQWQLAYSLQATYGLRNHEIFLLDLDDFPLAYIGRGKTNERYTYPLYPEWADQWELNQGGLPDCTGNANKDLGNRVTVAYKRQGVPFPPYTLRHCWAVRSLRFGLDLSLAAAQMGHSVRVHSEVYHHWISKDVHQKAMDLILSRSERPSPPT